MVHHLSYWEQNTWLEDIDHAVIGGGIVGLNCALQLRKRFPEAKIVVFERGMLPNGASTKNAGFACFGSVSEILADLETHSEEEVIALLRQRWEGLQFLRNQLGDDVLQFQQLGGYEVFLNKDRVLWDRCTEQMEYINQLAKHAISTEKNLFLIKNSSFSFQNTHKEVIFNRFEGQLHPGAMVHGLTRNAIEKGIYLLNNTEIKSFSSKNGQNELVLDGFGVIPVKNICVATNGFANQFLSEDITPARAQVVITNPIKGMPIQGTFHLDRGYYYFRNVGDRLLLGGGRELDFSAEETTENGLTSLVQNKLETLLRTTILPHAPFSIDRRWSGIMGVGPQKKPIVKKVAPRCYCGIRLGGMGVAIGSSVGVQLANLVESK
ncbi:NAD(P)/FAD-dependent oxidoreductase [Altibacter sp. HG106]|uniref:NAD(P)/FAD-dependent oxidoreductase n=1 Tax=Altibacter sp. HG106 TaxID=3023937 RepID=UPI00234FEDDB|nr:FAD-dependent oxidoreductase [Altibacter sp. HG106]MDC7994944.1 FAD-dependent oxidoreductase [Altibacter sp. HG106]